MATRQDVAKLAGVSPTTVSRVLNNNGYVSQDVRKRVEEAIRELQFVPNRVARSLRTQKCGQIACITHGLKNTFYAEIVQGIEEVALENGYTYSIYSTSVENEKYINLILEGFYDGLIVLTSSEFNNLVDSKKIREVIPTCFYWDLGYETKLPNVAVNLKKAMKNTTNYLLDCGHKEIVYLGYPKEGIEGVKENPRFLGYVDALKAKGIEVSSDHFLFVSNWNDTLTAGYEKVRELLDRGVSFTAIAACNDLMAIGAIRALSERGIRVPEDVSVTGFDDVEIAKMITPALTTVSLPKKEIGHTLMKSLLRQMNGEKLEGKIQEYESELMERETVQKI
ncbi:LacI family DNA-binding transcriptional regulator [Halalkalibacter alkaliphilus]|uniref:LacI family transcriptional regulator n=1 Tax=Halalkalibacter alkaliphilus TaxID=2917993 RepID=A0A9X2CTK0_9BACI|nr:LacI family DNA-binding transcriptional regulator [Halalkalibacter alkaliphilus]MCL7747988.1 LacI family transcriptional regulator [Halalkalibacter alkaliphilus]